MLLSARNSEFAAIAHRVHCQRAAFWPIIGPFVYLTIGRHSPSQARPESAGWANVRVS